MNLGDYIIKALYEIENSARELDEQINALKMKQEILVTSIRIRRQKIIKLLKEKKQ